jgi:hypothetical protein
VLVSVVFEIDADTSTIGRKKRLPKTTEAKINFMDFPQIQI